MRWTWAILLLANSQADARVVVEDFATTTGLWTDTGHTVVAVWKSTSGRRGSSSALDLWVPSSPTAKCNQSEISPTTTPSTRVKSGYHAYADAPSTPFHASPMARDSMS